MAAIAVAPPLVAAGPPGWVILGILGVATVGAAAIMKASEEADEDFADEEPTCIYHCPKDKENPSESKDEPKELPENPDDLLEDGYEETTRPGTPDHIRKFRNPKTGDEVEFHKGKPGEPRWEGKDHWHRYNCQVPDDYEEFLCRVEAAERTSVGASGGVFCGAGFSAGCSDYTGRRSV